MNKKDLKTLGAIATIGGVVVAVHGITSKRWQTAHTVLALVGAAVALATLA